MAGKMNDIRSNEYQSMLPVYEGSGTSANTAERVKAMAAPLLDWFYENRRDLPWRQDPTPYHVWISEIMLQQTRVEAVLPYYKRFLEALPEIRSLSEVEDDRLMKLWQGLGYYSRARNLKKAAIEAVENYEGNLPADHKKLLKMSGIGPYTAGAIASIAFGIRVPAVDGNVLRVIARLCGDETPIDSPVFKRMTEALLLENMPDERPGDFNQALMEIGALICIPNGAPLCEKCPLAGICRAKQEKMTDRIPVKLPKKKRRVEDMTVFLISEAPDWPEEAYDRDDFPSGNPLNAPAYLIRRRPDEGLLAGLYEFPHEEGHLDEDQVIRLMEEKYLGENASFALEVLPEAKHIFSHVEWRMKAYRIYLCSEYEPRNLPSIVNGGESGTSNDAAGDHGLSSKAAGDHGLSSEAVGDHGLSSKAVGDHGISNKASDGPETISMVSGRSILDSYAIPSAFSVYLNVLREEVMSYEKNI